MAYLSRGMRGPNVAKLQEQLNTVHKPYPLLVVDGIFGRLTDAAVRGFQRRRNLTPDGIVGPKTQAALDSPAPPGPSGASMYYVVTDVPHVHQDKEMSCWFASAQMLIQWKRNRRRMSDNHPDPSESPKWSKLYSDNTGITNDKIVAFARDMGFKHVPPMSPHPSAILGWLMSYGPLWVNGVRHITVITGIRGETGQKLYEYLAADRPILVVGDQTEAARVVTDGQAGIAVPLEDPEAIADGLADLVNGRVRTAADGIARKFDYAALTDELESHLEAAISATTTVR